VLQREKYLSKAFAGYHRQQSISTAVIRAQAGILRRLYSGYLRWALRGSQSSWEWQSSAAYHFAKKTCLLYWFYEI